MHEISCLVMFQLSAPSSYTKVLLFSAFIASQERQLRCMHLYVARVPVQLETLHNY
jgi:hypothetical protein